jgi:hypothetical protein
MPHEIDLDLYRAMLCMPPAEPVTDEVPEIMWCEIETRLYRAFWGFGHRREAAQC